MSEIQVPLLHLIDDQQNPVDPEIDHSVHSAYRWSLSKYRNKIDPSTLADFAEETGKKMAQKRSSIRSVSGYAFGAILGKCNDWWAKFGGKEHPCDPAFLEKLADLSNDPVFSKSEQVCFLQQLETLIKEQDREVFHCICKKLTNAQIAGKLGITEDAARMRVKRLVEWIERTLTLYADEFRQAMPRRDYQIVVLHLKEVPIKEIALRIKVTVTEVEEVLKATRARYGRSAIKPLPE